MENIIITVAANIFRLDPNSITLNTSQADLVEWDSFAHIALVTTLEEQHGFIIPIEDVEHIKTLEDFSKYSHDL